MAASTNSNATPVAVGNKTHYIIAVVLGQQTVQPLKSALDENDLSPH